MSADTKVEVLAESLVIRYLTIRPEVGSSIHLSDSDFLFARSEGNYCTLFYLEENAIKKHLLRIPLKILEAQVGSDRIAKCHRSFIVNLDKIANMKGNAQGFKLNIEQCAETIPVSRKYIDQVCRNS